MSKERVLKETLLTKGKEVLIAVIEQAKDGHSRHPHAHVPSQDKVWDALIPILQKVAERESIIASTNAEVLALLGKGKVTTAEAKELVAMIAMVNSPGLAEDMSNVNETKKLIIEIASGDQSDGR